MPDAVVIGAGPNGLVAANVLADAGWSVCLVEATEEVGGAVRTGELTLPGYRHDFFSAFYPLAAASPVLRSMDLERYGLTWRRAPLVLAHPLPDGRCASLSTDVEVTARSLEAFAAGDGEAWKEVAAEWEAIGDRIIASLLRPFPPVRSAVGLGVRLGVGDTLRFLRRSLLPARRLGEELFTGDGGRLLLAGNALHADLSPESSGSGIFGWLLCCLGQQFGFPVPEGGAGRLAEALAHRLRSRGGTVLCNTEVTEVLVRRGRAVGVSTATGEVVDADRAVLADVSAPHLYTKLVGRRHLPDRLFADLERFQWDVSTVKVDWALDGPVPWLAEDARRAGTVHVADDMDNLTEFAAQMAMGQLPSRPFLLFGQQSQADPTRSPPGTETAWAYTHVPRQVRIDAAGELSVTSEEPTWLPGFVDRIERRIEALAPGFCSSIKGRHVFSPGAMEGVDANLVMGAINGGTSQIHQQLIFRPLPGFGRAETPIASLYLASASAHPGGGVHGAAGSNAARAALLPVPRLRARAASAPWR